nr:unnamed protein product [Spirometra erinaceieuropaei]
MYGDDMKIWSVIRGPADEDRLQMNLNRLEEWSNRWLLRLNVAKCSILRLGNTARSTSTRGYFLGGAALQEVEAQRDLGVLTTSSLKPSAYCSKVAKSAMSVLHRIRESLALFQRTLLCCKMEEPPMPMSELDQIKFKMNTVTDENAQIDRIHLKAKVNAERIKKANEQASKLLK